MTILIIAAIALLASSSNPSNSRTGAPFDGHCNGCHGGNNPNGFSGDITIDGLPAIAEPGTTYPLSIRMTANTGNPARGGFQLVVVDNANVDYGDLIVPTGNTALGTETASGREYIEHRGAKNFAGNGSEIVWNFEWKALGAASGNTAKFYYIGNFCNGSGSSGDFQQTALSTISVAAPPALDVTINSNNVLCFGGSTGSATAVATGGTGVYSTYAWSNNANTVTANNLVANTYTVTVTDNGGTTGTASVVITQPTAIMALALASGTITCASSTAIINAGATGGTDPYSFSWSNGNTGNPIEVTTGGTYTVTVTDANNCTKTATATVASNVVQPLANTANATLPCSGGVVTLSGTGSSVGANFSYQWTTTAGNIASGASTLTPTVNLPGTYILVVTNNINGCTASDAAVVTASAPIVAGATGTTITCSSPTGMLNATASAPATYAWLGPLSFNSTLQSPVVSQPGIYTVTVTGTGTGCTATATAVVTAATTPPQVSVNVVPATCNNPVAIATASSTSGGVSYLWTWPGGSSTQPTVTIPSGNAVYTVVVTSFNTGCTAASTATYVGNTAPPTATLSVSSTLNCSTTATTIIATAQPAANLLYAWTGPGIVSGNNTTTVVVNQAGTYTTTITNVSNGCSATFNAIVVQDITVPNAIIATPPALSCNTNAITLDGSGSSQGVNITYQWSGPGILSGSNTVFPVVNAAGTYTLVVTNTANGCTASVTTLVTTAAPVNAFASNTPVSCFGGNNGASTVSAVGGIGTYTYNWSNGATTQSITGLSAGTYTVTVTDGDGCSIAVQAIITQPSAPLAPNVTTTPSGPGANNGTATANPSGGTAPYTYAWSNGGTTATIGDLVPGTYTVTVTDANGCTAVQTISVNNINCTLAATLSVVQVSCNGGSNGALNVNLTNAQPPLIYQWSTGASTPGINSLPAGVYTVTVTDATGCSVVVSATIGEPANLVVGISTTPESAIGANDASATATPTGGTAPYTFAWSNSGNTATITGLAPGTYTVTVTDLFGCTRTQSAIINALSCNLTTNISVQNINCNGQATGTASVSTVGGTSPFTYTWNTGGTTNSISGLLAGTYFVTVMDAQGCIVLDTATMTQPEPLVATEQTINNVTCTNEQSGSVVLLVTGGGTAPYQFTYPSVNQPQLGVGLYSITVTNSNGCTTLANFSIVAIDTVAPTVTCPQSIAKCDAGALTNFPLPTVQDNCLPIGLLYALLEGFPSGSYFPPGTTLQVFRVTDAAGNTNTCSFTITTYPLPDVLFVSQVNDINNTGVGSIDITPVMGTAPYAFEWLKNGDPFATTEDLTGLFAGSYRLSVTDANSCQVSLAPIIIQNVVGTTQTFASAGIRMWPNPVVESGMLYLEMTNIEAHNVLIMNSIGQLVFQANQLTNLNAFNIGQLGVGVFTIQLTDMDGMRYHAQFIQQ